MALCGCPNGLLVTTAVALLLLPIQLYFPEILPEIYCEKQSTLPVIDNEVSTFVWLDNAVAQFPPLDVLATVTLLLIGSTLYVYEWIHRKIMERRLQKLNRCLISSFDRLRSWDSQQEELENTLKMVQNATAEYNLLLYLLLQQNRCFGVRLGPTSDDIFEKSFQHDL